jgi:hypothetical protein
MRRMRGSLTRAAAWAGLVAQPVFVIAWLVAAAWQGPGYSVTAHTISDMYAVTAPSGLFLVVVITLCGVATVLFALFALRPALRSAGGAATVGCVLLALSIYGIGDALTPFEREACRLADAGCTAADQTANAGGALDAILSTIGIFLFVAATFVLAAAMKRVEGWRSWAWPARWVGFGFLALLVALVATESADLGGLFERLLAATGAAAIAAAAARVLSTLNAAAVGGDAPLP